MSKTASNVDLPVGRFITFEGGEGAGKSTQIAILADRLNGANHRTITTREPGGSAGAEIVRHLVLSGMGKFLGAEAEALLFAAARDDHVHQVIAPALRRGIWVLCDRFTDSTRVYQGKLGKVDPALLRAMERVTIGELRPDLTLIFDVPVAIGLRRAILRRGKTAADRFEQENIEFHEKLREAYRQVAVDEPERCVLIDANADQETVAARVWAAVKDRLLLAVDIGETSGA
ncbi:thymidylate kinase [Afipia sp. Root123D2]|uniref:dTMP kinase n=1 Tax=Afipia sp. Root123D2 TaxID=1736436 RepID=UPI00070156B6|nr:dTMP kinase [Afipia sp. Root123D2]KQW23067.1 thymidylate kinase [Afipia sp. Root123D2]